MVKVLFHMDTLVKTTTKPESKFWTELLLKTPIMVKNNAKTLIMLDFSTDNQVISSEMRPIKSLLL